MVEESSIMSTPFKKELGLILKEIRVITDKIREEDDSSTVEGDYDKWKVTFNPQKSKEMIFSNKILNNSPL